MNLSYQSSTDILFLYDVLGGKTLASWTHNGDYGVYRNLTVGGDIHVLGGIVTENITINKADAAVTFNDLSLYPKYIWRHPFETWWSLVVENALSAGAGFSVTGDVGVTGNVWANGAFVSWLNSPKKAVSSAFLHLLVLMVLWARRWTSFDF